ncbi:MAG TPA: DUF488 domain-containing protein [Parachlamydiaceae bacterium]|nr:DUF488 domain-containing protein [Parachlamydiaceae bacterium]
MKNIEIKRVYENPSPTDGVRILVDRLWPRGIKKNELIMDDWIKDLSPSTDLRKWFNHDPSKFKEFGKKYIEELDDTRKIWFPLIKKYLSKKITLLYAAHDQEINHAICLKNYLEKHLP